MVLMMMMRRGRRRMVMMTNAVDLQLNLFDRNKDGKLQLSEMAK